MVFRHVDDGGGGRSGGGRRRDFGTGVGGGRWALWDRVDLDLLAAGRGGRGRDGHAWERGVGELLWLGRHGGEVVDGRDPRLDHKVTDRDGGDGGE